MGSATSKVEARKAARQAQAAAQAAAALRAKLNVEDLATFFAAQSRADAVEEWLVQQQGKLHAEADGRRAAQRRTAGAALRSIRDRGETTRSVAALAGISETVVRALIKEAATPSGSSGSGRG
ncbi:MAG: hypothetical protein JO044_00190 [Mycobacteriaceae bacterium]|nr:hypothetical protein [Mycobacteriaceae bacterium]MBV9639648.1 hypothetical protein [Mycobacteriaceae bacterium]